ncbi:MAG: monovalent cation/H(+) antiporter subunit G [Candidatus Omnitrophica bacterium]|nr:monovalent cation/H(+) antiporter subunit G [Candidatus Omnitrophota bacterium]MDD5236623.1 monovalent cation/H(+) antiporter subunit G [Candidatus Omnitrophota bacterium]MDD5609994.1 monovalent cation/H(+) antiporter subunit G [Candidatus Omnitrophota bacterium]
MNNIIGTVFIIIGLVFDVIGCIGLIRFPDVYSRLQSSTKCAVLGTVSILLGTFIIRGVSPTGVKAFLTAVFLLLTAPVAAHALARGAYKSAARLWEKSVCDDYAENK